MVYIGFSNYTDEYKYTIDTEERWKKTLLASLCIIYFSAASAGISTKKQDILKLIGTSYAPNGKFA